MGALLRRLSSFFSRPGANWEGVYKSLSEVQALGPGFDGDVWLTQSMSRFFNPVEDDAARHLALLAATLLSKNSPVKILDFGGNLGFGYTPLMRMLSNPAQLEYQVIETARVCSEGKKLFAADTHISFHDALPAANTVFNIVYSRSSLQYIDDYAGLLLTLAAYKAEFILLAGLPLSAGVTFATAQKNVSGSVIPFWFFKASEIVDIMSRSGYRLMYKSDAEPLGSVEQAQALGYVPNAGNFLFKR